MSAVVGPSGSGKSTLLTIDGMLSELDMAKCKNQYPAKMSGGEKQRVAIARAFVNDQWSPTMNGYWIWLIRSTIWKMGS